MNQDQDYRISTINTSPPRVAESPLVTIPTIDGPISPTRSPNIVDFAQQLQLPPPPPPPPPVNKSPSKQGKIPFTDNVESIDMELSDDESPQKNTFEIEELDEGMFPNNVPEQNMFPRNVPEQNMFPANVPDQNMFNPNVPDQNMFSPNVPDQNVFPINVADGNMFPVDVPDQNVFPTNIADRNMFPVDVPDQDVFPPNVPEQNVFVPEQNVLQPPPPIPQNLCNISDFEENTGKPDGPMLLPVMPLEMNMEVRMVPPPNEGIEWFNGAPPGPRFMPPGFPKFRGSPRGMVGPPRGRGTPDRGNRGRGRGRGRGFRGMRGMNNWMPNRGLPPRGNRGFRGHFRGGF